MSSESIGDAFLKTVIISQRSRSLRRARGAGPDASMFHPDDTIVAIATPPGRGGIGVVRHQRTARAARSPPALTGRRSRARAAARDLRADCRGRRAPIDQVVVTLFPAPHSYTGEDVVEISAHGSPVVLRGDRRRGDGRAARGSPSPASSRSARICSGRIDLVQAEAVADLIDAVTPLQARVAFDQLEGTLTGADRATSTRAARSDRAARGVAGFSRRGLSLRRRRATRRARLSSLIGDARRAAARRGARPAGPRRPARSRSSAGRTPASRACSTGSPARRARS